MRILSVASFFGVLMTTFSAFPMSPASAESEAAAILAAIASDDRDNAGKLLNQMVEASLTKNTLRPDPELDRLFAITMFEFGYPAEARAMLDRVLAAKPAEAIANESHLMRAHVLEDLADFQGAEGDYRKSLAAFAPGTPKHRDAVFGLARVLISDDPDEAIRIVSEELADAQGDLSWEGQLILSRAAAISGRREEAAAALDRAWTLAWTAPAASRAVTRIVSDKALQAGLAGNREALVALTAVSRATRFSGFTPAILRANLPHCGSEGISSTDWVVIELINTGRSGSPQARLVYANRPKIARPFLKGLVTNPAFRAGEIGAPSISFEMRCLTAPSDDYAVVGDMPSLLGEWLISKGVYPIVPENQNNGIATLSQQLTRRESLFGPESPMLIPVLTRLYSAYTEQGFGQPGPAMQPLVDIVERIEKIVGAADAPADIRLMQRLATLGVQLGAQTSPLASTTDEYESALANAASNPSVSLDLIYTVTSGATRQQAPGSRDFKTKLAQLALAAFEKRTAPGDRRGQVLALRVADLIADRGDLATATTVRKKAGFSLDLCRFSDPKTSLVRHDFTSEDFPKDALKADIHGVTAIDFGISASGQIEGTRIVLSDPPMMFNSVTLAESKMFSYEAPRINGKPSTCNGQVRNIVWQFPY